MKQDTQNGTKRVSVCEYRLDAIVCHNKQLWNEDKCRCECKQLIDKGVCDKGSIRNPSNCEYEWDKSCDIGKYLDYENYKCRKRLIDQLVDECTETVQAIRTLVENENSYKCSYFTMYTVLFWIFFTIKIGGTGAYFIYFYWYLKKDLPYVDFNTHKETAIY